MATASASKDPRELHALKLRAVKYYNENGVPQKMEEILNSMFYEDPADVYGHLANYFEKFTKPAALRKVEAFQVFDSAGQPTIQTDVFCTVNNKVKKLASSTIPSADIKVRSEEKEKAILDMHESVKTAIQIINSDLENILFGLDPLKQKEIDTDILSLIEKKKEEELAKKAVEEENQEEPPPPPPPADDKDKKKSKEKEVETKGGKNSAPITIVPEKPLEFFTAGSELVASVSQGVCACAAEATKITPYRHIANIARKKGALHQFRIPLPMVTIIQSGKQALGKVNCIKEYMLIPGINLPINESLVHIQNIYNHVAKALSSKMGVASKYVNDSGALCPALDVPTQALDLLQEAVNAEDLTIGEDMYLAINCAAHECFDYEKGKYEILSGSMKSADELVEFWADIIAKYPAICALIDPLRGQDSEAWMKLCERISEAVYIIGDHFYDRPGLLKKQEPPSPVQSSGIVMRLERLTTISDIIDCTNTFEDLKNELIISTNQGDTTDTFIVDLAVGLNARFLKVGGPCRGERVCKLNRLLQIFNELDQSECVPECEEVEESPVKSSKDINGTETDEPAIYVENTPEQDQADVKDLTWGENEKNCFKKHTPFSFPFIQNPPPPEEDHEDEAEKDEKASLQTAKSSK